MKLRTVFVLLTFVAASDSVTVGQGSSPERPYRHGFSAQDVLNGMERHFASLDGLYLECKYTTQPLNLEENGGGDETNVTIWRSVVAQEGSQMFVREVRDVKIDGRWEPVIESTDYTMADRLLYLKRTRDQPMSAVVWDLSRARQIIAERSGEGALFGLIDGDLKPLMDILQSADEVRVVPEAVNVGGFPCVRLEVLSKHGEYSISVDPQANFVIRHLVSSKSAGDIYYGSPLLSEDERRADSYDASEFHIEIYNVEVKQVGNRYIPIRETTEIRTKAGDYEHGRRTVAERSNVTGNPNIGELAEEALAELQEGQLISNLDTKDLSFGYQWREGAIVPAYENGATVVGHVKFDAELNPHTNQEFEVTALLIPTRAAPGEIRRATRIRFLDDSEFRIEDVPPGSYEVNVRLTKRRTRTEMDSQVTHASRTIDLPAADDDENPIINAGLFHLSAANIVQLGYPAPDFAFEMFDGERRRLSDYRGRYVLLDFWATWCPPCLEETPNLVSTFAEYSDESRFAMIGLSLDDNVGDPKAYTEENQMNWEQGILLNGDRDDLPIGYNNSGVPFICLIGPDGIVVERDLRGPRVAAAIREALNAEKDRNRE